ncbi:glycine cleavage system aminomethyltransferase GcvT [Hoeflea sp. CAU 1731]
MTKTLPLSALHEAASARFGPFAGYSMPISYPLGVMKEHLHTRSDAGLFDISHMSHIEVEGPDAGRFIAHACPYHAGDQAIGTGRYTFMLNETGGIIDDLIVSRLSDTGYLVVANGACAEKDLAHLHALAADFDVSVSHRPRVFLALQGPKAAEVLSRHLPESSSLTFMQVLVTDASMFVSRSGYTGEDGFEIAFDPGADAIAFAENLAKEPEVEWIGLGARDSLRIEAGLPLYGQDMDETVDPLSAGLVWAIPKDLRTDGAYIGAKAIAEYIEAGADRKKSGLAPEGKAPVRGDVLLYDSDSNEASEIGVVTSGGFGPSCGHPVAIASVDRAYAVGDTVYAEVRGRKLACTLQKLPFVPHNYKRGKEQ